MYKFKKYVKYRKSFDGISVNANTLYLSNPFMQRFDEKTEYVSVLFDPKSRAVAIQPANKKDDGAYFVTRSASKYGGSRVGVSLASEGMEKGRYLFKESGKQGVICAK